MHGKFNKTPRANVKAQARRPKPSPKFLAQFHTWLYHVHHDPEMPPSALAILLEIAWPMSSIGQCSWPSLETIGENCGLSKPSAVRLVQQLVARGHLLAEGGRPGRGHATRYRINIIGTEPRTASEAQAVPNDERIQANNRAAPASLKGFVADLLDRDPTPVKGFVADLNKKERKKELRERVFKTTDIESAETHSLDRPPESLGHVTPVPDAASLPVNTTALDAPVSFPTTETGCAPDGATTEFEKDQCLIDRPVPAEAVFNIRGGDEIEDGGAANNRRSALFVFPRKSTGEKNPPVKSEESTVPKPAPDPAVVAADNAFFAMLLETYPRRDAAEAARAAYDDAVSASDNPAQTRCLILDRAIAYEAEMRAAGKHTFESLRAFIEGGSWRPEFLPFNIAQATAKAA